MCGQRYGRLNLDLHAMTEAPESQTHVVDVVGAYCGMADQSYRGRPKEKSPDRRSASGGSGTVGAFPRAHPARVAIVCDRQMTT